MSLAYLKGLKTRYKNLLEVELGKSEELLTREVSDFDLESQIRKVNKSYRRFDEFGPKFEETLERLSLALETAKAEEDLKTFQKESELYFNIITEVTSRKEELKLIDNFLQEKYKNLSKPEPDSKIEQLIEIQIQMMQQMQLQNAKPQHDELNQAAVKLPKLEIMGYNGEKQKFKEFWDQFEVTVHKNTKLSNVEKFSYLKSKLYGTAQSAISGLQLSNENYDVAIDILKDRFGDIQNAVNAHYVELINLSCASNRTSELRFLYDKIERNLRSLEALNQNIDQDVFISMITTKLPEAVLVQLEIQKGSDRWTVDKLRDLLKSYIAAREAAEIQSKEKTNDFKPQQPPNANVQSRYKPSYGKPQNVRSSGEALFSATNDKPFTPTRTEVKKLCIYCKGSHWSDECSLYKTVEDRKAQLNGLCYICLKSGHRLRECSSDRKCVYCSKTKKHHRSLCLKKFPTNRTEISNLVDEAVESTESVTVSLTTEPSFLSSGDIVLMQTAKTIISNTSDTCNEEIRLLLDSGSQRTYVSETLAKKLRLKVESVEEVSVITFGSDKPKLVKTEKVTLQMKLVDGTKMKISANVVPKITGSVLRRPVSIKNCQNYEYLWNNFNLADTLPTENEKTTIELLIGNDYYLDIILPEKIEIQPGLYLLGSKFGWIITGRTSEKSDGFEEPSMLILNYGTNALPLLDSCAVTAIDKSMPIKPPLEDFWNLETIGISEPSEDSNDTKALEKFNNSVEYTNERYLVCWPWKSEIETLNDNKELAYGRYRSLLHRLRNKPELFENYDKIINEQCEKGIIEKVDVTNKHEDHITHYIPHHAVVDSTKPTTKVRIVYDASAKTRDDNKSLNNCLYRGPVMLKDLCGLLLRFRMFKYAVVADIEKAFLQLGLQNPDRDVTRFFWVKDRTMPLFNINNVQIYRFCRVPFGVISSPFLLAATIDLHLRKYNTPVATKIQDNIYVDNLLTGVNTNDELKELYTESKSIFQEASMNLRDWCSNSAQFMSDIPKQDQANRERMKVLGINWTIKDDKLAMSGPKLETLELSSTKREILQSIASIFDPLGFFSPVTLLGKLLLQTLWSKKVEWDFKLSENDCDLWKEIAFDIKQIQTHTFDRYIGLNGKCSYQLLCFCDASTKAYACAIYLRHETNESCRVDLIYSKTRLAPIKKVSIPRLELLAVIIGIRCLAFIESNLKITVEKKTLWTDSQCVIHWIASKKQMSTFVENRLKEIRKCTDTEFRYVSTDINPADIASRGTHFSEIKSNNLWWKGPSWLLLSNDQWPTWSYNLTTENVNLYKSEIKPSTSYQQTELLVGEPPSGVNCDRKLESPYGMECENFSSLIRLLRITAWVQRFIKKLKKDTISGPLTAKEIEDAKFMWIVHIQRKHFAKEIHDITKNKSSNVIRQLGLTIDNNGLIRCVGRIEHADISENAKRPILLPKKEAFTKLLIYSYHRNLLHVGVAQTLSQIRQKYWIPQGRSTVRHVLRSCGNCIRYEGGPYKMPLIPPLPKNRVTESSPYTYTGIDYFGPLYVKTVNGSEKVWVCLYTCLVVRAIHLELMLDMTTDQFLLGFRRFVARCGTPIQIISDNALQFKAASNVVQQEWKKVLYDSNIQNYVSNKGINWKFIVELAPWMGGFYERLVGLAKRSLRKTIGKVCLSVEQLRTLLTEVEAVVNSRPLAYIGEDIDSNIVLTPSCFLTLNKHTGIPERIDNDEDPEYKPQFSSTDNLLEIWKKGQKHLNRFWKVWRDDYLLSIRERTTVKLKEKRVRSNQYPQIGDIVLIKDNLPRGMWKIGKIINLSKSSDEQCRSAKVLLPSKKTLNRTLNFLYPLECHDDNVEQTDNVNNVEQNSKCETQTSSTRPQRRAATQAKQKIQEWTS